MSRLSVYWPDEIFSNESTQDEPRILKFPGVRQQSQDAGMQTQTVTIPMDVVTRARVLFSNRSCNECGYPVVEPIELPDSTVNRNGLAIPGTATLVGFRCCGCKHQWPV